VIGPWRETRSNVVPLTCLPNSKGLYGISQIFVTSGNNIVTSCPGQVTHSFNSRDPLGQKSQTTSQTTSNAIAPTISSATDISENGTSANSDGGRTAAIVGGTLGAVILLGLLFTLFRRIQRHLEGRRGMGFWGKHGPISDYDPVLAPYVDSVPGGSMNQTRTPSTFFSHSGQNGVAGAGVNITSQKAARAAQVVAVSTPTPTPMAAPTPVDHGSGVQVRQHTDATGIIELPPAYRDALPL
jgi:hypothetical protein